MGKMTSVTPTSESTSPTTVPNVIAPKSAVISGEFESDFQEKSELWKNRKQLSHVQSVSRKASLDVQENLSIESNAPLGFELEGRSCGDISTFSEGSSGAVSPNCLKWAESLQVLLNDADGLNLFQQYLEHEDPERYHMLEFWLACKGLSKQPPKQVHQLVKVIYTQLFLKAQLGIGDGLRKLITQQIKDASSNNRLLSSAVFNDACRNVEKVMNEVMYPNFLSSEIYLNYVQKMQGDVCNIGGNSSEDPGSPGEAPALPEEEQDVELPENVSHSLPVVEEDEELVFSSCPRSEIYATQRRRSAFVKLPEDFFSVKFLQQYGNSSRQNTSRRLYHCSYNPVSRQDSELQSLSSDARTDSMSDLSIDDMTSVRETYAYKKQLQRQLRQMKENASRNQTSDVYFKLIPRTSNPRVREQAKPQEPKIFAKNLIQKLDKLKKERESGEIMAQKLNAIDDDKNEYSAGVVSQQALVDILPQKSEDECQEILDNHVSRIWSDKTPGRSPSVGTPVRPKSPDNKKLWPAYVPTNKIISHASNSVSRVLHSYVGANSLKKKDKDVYSLFSSDSGNGTDPAEGMEHQHRNLAKSKSVCEHANQISNAEIHFSGYCQRGINRTWSSSRRTLSDSGVSVISSGNIENVGLQPSQHRDKNELVSSWLSESNKLCDRRTTCSVNSEEGDSIVSTPSKYKAKSCMSRYIHSSSKNKTNMWERDTAGSGNVKNILPGQPFVADPSMPPFPFHSVDTDTQLEETRRRLNEMGQKSSRLVSGASYLSKTSESSTSGIYCQSGSKIDVSNHRYTTLVHSNYKSSDESSFTTVVYNFSDEKMPYLSKVPGCPITLKQFKEYMPKKGRYRYFFVTPCEDLEMRPIQEEITEDNQFLPLWKGKVNAQIKSVD